MKFVGGFAALACVTLSVAAPAAAKPASADIAQTIKADVAKLIAGINAHDVTRATAFDAPDIVSMESGRPPSTGIQAEREGLGFAFKANPDWRIRLVDETVDVAKAGDMAVYRGTYHQDSSQDGAPMTQLVNFIAGFKRQQDGSWKVAWSVVSNIERPHKM
jgi:ketosteroid isomerase-like protein